MLSLKQRIISEGVWNLPEAKDDKYITELEKFQKTIWNKFGDDLLMDDLDSAIKRMKDLYDKRNQGK